jgi:hypothetical protein
MANSIFGNPAAAPASTNTRTISGPLAARRRRTSPKNAPPSPRNRRVRVGVIRSAADRQPLDFNLSGTARAQDPSQRLFSEFERARQEGLEANETRFQEILGGFRERLSTALSNLEGLGEQEAADINRSFDEFSANQSQDLISRGLSASTVAPVVAGATERERQGSLGNLNDRLRQQRLSTEAQLQGDVLGFSERREDLFPSFQDVAGLAQNIGQQQGRSILQQQMLQAQQQQRQFAPIFAQNFAGIQNVLRNFSGGGGGFAQQGGRVPFLQRLNNANRARNQAEINRFRAQQRNDQAFLRGF